MTGFKRTLHFAAGFILTILIIEIYLVTANIAKTNWTVLDRELGKTNKPDQNVIYFSEGFYLGKINALRYLGPAYPMDQPSGVKRIKLLGDSFVEGMHVFDEFHFRTILESKLNSRGGDSVQVLNFGKGIFDFYDMYCYEENYSSGFESDINLYFLHNIDFAEDRDPAMPWVYIENDELRISDEFSKSERFNSYEKLKPVMNSAIGRLAFNGYKLLPDAPAIIFDKFYTPFAKEPVTQAAFHVEFTDEAKKIIDKLALSDQNVLVLFDEIQDDILSYIQESGIRTIQLADKLDKIRNAGIDINYWEVTNETGHLNHQGHQAVAELLFEELKQLI